MNKPKERNLSTGKVWVVEEIKTNGNIGHRQTTTTRMEDLNTKEWAWDRPDGVLNESQRAEWDRIMTLLKNVKGEDLRHVVCAVGLMDHCLGNNKNYID